MAAAGRRRADHRAGDRRDHRHDAARQRDRRRAHRARAARHRPHRPELRHRARRDERAPAHLSKHARIPLSVHAQRRPARCSARTAPYYPLTPDELADGARRVRQASTGCRARRRLLRHDARAHRARSSTACAACERARAPPAPRAGRRLALPAGAVPPGHVGASRSASAPTPTARKAFREAMLAERLGRLRRASPATRPATARTCSTSASTTSAATASPTWRELAGRLATASTLPLVLDSTEPDGAARPGWSSSAAGRHQLGQLRGRRRARARGSSGSWRSSTSTARPSSRSRIDEEGQARTAEWKVAVAERLIDDLTAQLGHARESTSSSTALTFPIATGQEESRRDGSRPSRRSASSSGRHPDVQTTLGVSNVSFGLNPAARVRCSTRCSCTSA